MAEADVNDRTSVERAYPREAFEEDAGMNARPKTEVLHGIRIDQPADARGRFRLSRAAQHVGEDERARSTVFLSPVLVETAGSLVEKGEYGAMQPTGAPVEKGRDYPAFIDRIIDAAREAEPVEAPGRGDERLAGPRQ
jgi:hypothetical protein